MRLLHESRNQHAVAAGIADNFRQPSVPLLSVGRDDMLFATSSLTRDRSASAHSSEMSEPLRQNTNAPEMITTMPSSVHPRLAARSLASRDQRFLLRPGPDYLDAPPPWRTIQFRPSIFCNMPMSFAPSPSSHHHLFRKFTAIARRSEDSRRRPIAPEARWNSPARRRQHAPSRSSRLRSPPDWP